MRVIFMGTPDFSVGTLEALIEAGHEVCLAVTQPDKPKGRGKEMQFPPVKEAALSHGIPVFQPVKVREAACVEELAGYSGTDTIWMCQCTCVSASEIQRSGTDPVGDH